jgi:hypothetical protein
MQIEKPLPCGEIDAAIRPHGRDDGDQTTRKHVISRNPLDSARSAQQ